MRRTDQINHLALRERTDIYGSLLNDFCLVIVMQQGNPEFTHIPGVVKMSILKNELEQVTGCSISYLCSKSGKAEPR